MASTTIYDLPDDVSGNFAIAQEAYDQQIAAGMVTSDGRLEAAASQATQVREVASQPGQVSLLMGSHIRTLIAYIPTLPTYGLQRNASPLEAPSLGNSAKRAFDKQKVMDVIEEVEKGDKSKGLKIAKVIEQTIIDNDEIAYVRGRMGEVMAV